MARPCSIDEKLADHLTEDALRRVKNLHQKYGQDPLINLVRKLIVRLDEAEYREKSHEILQNLTGNFDLPDKPANWLDWLEEQPDEVTWDVLLNSQPVVKEEVKSEPSQPEVPLSKKQALWKEAMRRHESGSGPWLKRSLYIAAALLVVVLVYWVSTKPGNVKSKARVALPEKSERYDIGHSFAYWGDFHTPRLASLPWLADASKKGLQLNRGFFAALDVGNLPALPRKQVIQILEESTLPKDWMQWAGYFYHKKFEEGMRDESISHDELLPIGSLKSHDKTWDWRRYLADKKESIIEGYVRERLVVAKDKATLTLWRVIPGHSGSVHTILLNRFGVREWHWLCKTSTATLKGKVLRSKSGKELKCSLSTKGVVLSPMKVKDRSVLLPGIWSPTLNKYSRGKVILPHAQRLISFAAFYRLKVTDEASGFNLMGIDSLWNESWKLRQKKRVIKKS